ncbi:hypothetical protein MMC18_000437 [Xylographa bjoerkii]|nr:hypothetical protein [Xylographa bjoerkii]
MGYWGEKIFQSDTALDLIDEISSDAGFELYMFDNDAAENAARDVLNSGLPATLVTKHAADAPDTGAIVNADQRTMVKTLIPKIATPDAAKKQMTVALRVYKSGEPYHFDSPGK